MSTMDEMVLGLGGTFLILWACLYVVSKINYRIDDRYLRLRIWGLNLRKVALEDIRDAQRGYKHWSESWTNTIYMPTIRERGVTLYRRSRKSARIVLTPDDPERFIAHIKSHPRFGGERG